MDICEECKLPIEFDSEVCHASILYNDDQTQLIKYLHHNKCCKAYFSKQTEDHIIKGEN